MRLAAPCAIRDPHGPDVLASCYGEYPDGSFVSDGSCPAGFQLVPFSGSTGDSRTPYRFGASVCVPLPKAPAPAPAPTITVSPNIAVSPQVSPNFTQQMQPQNSPVSAGALQSGSGGASSAPPASSGPASSGSTPSGSTSSGSASSGSASSGSASGGLTKADIQAQIDAALAMDRASRASSVGTVVPQNSAGVPSLAVPAYTPPAYNGGDSVGGAIIYAGNPAQSAQSAQSAAVPQSTTPPDRTMLYVGLGAAALLLLLLSKPRRA
jgi:hypothetical protein